VDDVRHVDGDETVREDKEDFKIVKWRVAWMSWKVSLLFTSKQILK